VIHAGSIVTKDVGPYEIWAGSPARKVAHRTENVPPSKQKLFEELVERHGIQKDRYMDVSNSGSSKDSAPLP